MRLLEAGGFTELKEKETWKVKPLGKVKLTLSMPFFAILHVKIEVIF